VTEDHDAAGPLDGVTVLDLTHALSGPFSTLLLADMGARVIKVERPPGDTGRYFAPLIEGEALFFHAINRGKECIALELGEAEDRQLFEALVRAADVAVENFRPGTLDRLGYGFDALAALNPRIVLASVSGFGQTGPQRWEGAYDTVIQGCAGLMSITGEPGSGPMTVGTSIADYLSGVLTFGAICAALHGVERTGAGTHIDVAMHDAIMSILGAAMLTYLGTGRDPHKTGNSSPLAAPFDVFEASDGWLTLCAADDLSYGRLCDALGRPDLATEVRFGSVADRVAHYDELRPVLAEVLATRTVEDWIGVLQPAGVPCGPINTLSRAFEEAQTRARNMVVGLGDGMRVPGNPIKMSTLPDPETRERAASFGAHTEAIRAEFLGDG